LASNFVDAQGTGPAPEEQRSGSVSEEADSINVSVPTTTIVYNHHSPNLTEEQVDAQHHAGGGVLAATHVHLDHHNCLEVVIMRGLCKELRHLSDHILSLRGAKHSQLMITSTRKDLK
jgi:CopG family transcriptional regulator, nickel-responsive regulator